MEELSGVLDELAFPGTMTAIGEIWEGTRANNREASAVRVRKSKWRTREIDGLGRNGKRRTIGLSRCFGGCKGVGLGRESERRRVRFEAYEIERKIVNGDDGVRGRAFQLEGRVTTTGRYREGKRRSRWEWRTRIWKMLQPIRDGFQVKLKSWREKVLTANGRTPPWTNSVTRDEPHTGSIARWILWDVEAVLMESLAKYLSSVSSFSSVPEDVIEAAFDEYLRPEPGSLISMV
ncbi:hypothetical protein GH714_036311 [Hevea brasiliensis]|uniref:DUF569 domain-containing protein n=1 Tax=Hevea brasiliensis TaxID=3981 RepID=A0A6A6LLZ1_HEVBR|nr:hypothetical protein GH714_036311 [Hevea brasiliensis]